MRMNVLSHIWRAKHSSLFSATWFTFSLTFSARSRTLDRQFFSRSEIECSNSSATTARLDQINFLNKCLHRWNFETSFKASRRFSSSFWASSTVLPTMSLKRQKVESTLSSVTTATTSVGQSAALSIRWQEYKTFCDRNLRIYIII